MADGSHTPPANPRSAPDAVWALVRRDYRSGLPAPEVCRRHGVGLTSMRNRAAREGWRRADGPWTPPNGLDPCDEGVLLEEQVGGDLDKVELYDLSAIARRRMMRAVMRGQAAEALRWRRLRLVLDADEAEMEREMAQQEQVWHMLHSDPELAPEAVRAKQEAARAQAAAWLDGEDPED